MTTKIRYPKNARMPTNISNTRVRVFFAKRLPIISMKLKIVTDSKWLGSWVLMSCSRLTFPIETLRF
jgi:hypothetical protein